MASTSEVSTHFRPLDILMEIEGLSLGALRKRFGLSNMRPASREDVNLRRDDTMAGQGLDSPITTVLDILPAEAIHNSTVRYQYRK